MRRVALVIAAAALVTLAAEHGGRLSRAAAANAVPADSDKPYQVTNGKVDRATYKGYLYYGDVCMRCHGPDGAGSSYAPSLVDSLKVLTKDMFVETVINGKQDVNTAQKRVMPALGTNQDVVENLDGIYGYLKARSDGVLGRGHPERLDE